MSRSPQSFEKRQRERLKQRKREEKLERRLVRSEEKKQAKEAGEDLTIIAEFRPDPELDVDAPLAPDGSKADERG